MMGKGRIEKFVERLLSPFFTSWVEFKHVREL